MKLGCWLSRRMVIGYRSVETNDVEDNMGDQEKKQRQNTIESHNKNTSSEGGRNGGSELFDR